LLKNSKYYHEGLNGILLFHKSLPFALKLLMERRLEPLI
jgi:hypothetical protein